MSEVTCILLAIDQGDPRAAEQLLPLIYEEFRLQALPATDFTGVFASDIIISSFSHEQQIQADATFHEVT